LESARFCDLALARQLEGAEAAVNRAFVETRARIDPLCGAVWSSIEGATALFDGPASPLTQTFGVGLYEPASAAGLAALERFFADRAASTCHEISPLADPALLDLLPRRGYVPVELTSVLFRPLHALSSAGAAVPAAVRAHAIERAESARWGEVAARALGDDPAMATFMLTFARVTAERADARMYLAEIDGEAVATATLCLADRVAVLAAASTVPSARGRGAHAALLAARLEDAAARGCDLAAIGAAPGSPSQRNAERHGFRIAYTRIKWRRSSSEG